MFEENHFSSNKKTSSTNYEHDSILTEFHNLWNWERDLQKHGLTLWSFRFLVSDSNELVLLPASANKSSVNLCFLTKL